MRLYILLFICLSSISLACADIKEGKGTSSELSKEGINGMDTLIYSNPKNYSYTLEKAEGAANVEVRSYKDMFALFEKHKYTPESWQAGIREVPRIYLPLIGDRWGPTTSKEITIDNKKRLFFRGLAPMVLRANELIMVDRNQLKSIRSSYNENKMSDEDNKWILKLAKLYKVELNENGITTSSLDELWEKVDIVPVSLALAQAAEESGWGTSKFADKGNALYGQWTWGENAITPEKQRKELGNYGIASFETLQQSICAYMLNLNTHNAYASLRSKRAELRNKEQKVTGYDLAGQLTKYSERGEEYVKGLRSLMEYNRLRPTDEAYLSNGAPVYLVPVAN